MERRPLADTGLDLSVLSFGASSIGAEFRPIDVAEALRCVRVALDRGMNYIDTAAYYGRGMKYRIFASPAVRFSARRVAESIDISLERMGVDYVDIVFCHDIEFVPLDPIVEETLPALRKQVEQGKVRFIGVSGYPMKMFKEMLSRTELDAILTYNHYTLQNDMALDLVAPCREKNVGLINAAPFSARLLTGAPLPDWHKSTPEVRQVAAKAAAHCKERGSDIAKLALQYSVANENFASCVSGSANPDRVSQWCDWLEEPIDEQLVKEVKQILEPIHNWVYVEGLPENNDG